MTSKTELTDAVVSYQSENNLRTVYTGRVRLYESGFVELQGNGVLVPRESVNRITPVGDEVEIIE